MSTLPLAVGESAAAWMRASAASAIGPRKSTPFWRKRSAPPLVMPVPDKVTGSAANRTAEPPPWSSSAAPSATAVPPTVVPSAFVPRICKAPASTASAPENVLSCAASTIRPAPRFASVREPATAPETVKSTAASLVHAWSSASTTSALIPWEPVAPAATPMPPPWMVRELLARFTLMAALVVNRMPFAIWLPFR